MNILMCCVLKEVISSAENDDEAQVGKSNETEPFLNTTMS